MNVFSSCIGDFTRILCSSISSLDVTTVQLSDDILIQWIEYISQLPVIPIKQYDFIIDSFCNAIYYATGESVTIHLSHVPTVVLTVRVLLTRHLSQLVRVLSYHVPEHSELVLQSIQTILMEQGVCLIPSPIRRELLLLIYSIYRNSKEASKIKEVVTAYFREEEVEELFEICSIQDESFLSLIHSNNPV